MECKFFKPFDLKHKEDAGNCRRYAPRIIFINHFEDNEIEDQYLTFENDDIYKARWPSVFPDDWCGEFKRNEKIIIPEWDDIDWSVRVRLCLSKKNIYTLDELIEYTKDDLLSIPNFGQTSLFEVRRKLRQLGLKLKRTNKRNQRRTDDSDN